MTNRASRSFNLSPHVHDVRFAAANLITELHDSTVPFRSSNDDGVI